MGRLNHIACLIELIEAGTLHWWHGRHGEIRFAHQGNGNTYEVGYSDGKLLLFDGDRPGYAVVRLDEGQRNFFENLGRDQGLETLGKFLATVDTVSPEGGQ